MAFSLCECLELITSEPFLVSDPKAVKQFCHMLQWKSLPVMMKTCCHCFLYYFIQDVHVFHFLKAQRYSQQEASSCSLVLTSTSVRIRLAQLVTTLSRVIVDAKSPKYTSAQIDVPRRNKPFLLDITQENFIINSKPIQQLIFHLQEAQTEEKLYNNIFPSQKSSRIKPI